MMISMTVFSILHRRGGKVSDEPLPGVLGNTGTVAFIFREQGIFSNYFQGTGELLTRLLGSFLGTRGFSNGEQGIKSKKVKGSWEHAPPPGRGSVILHEFVLYVTFIISLQFRKNNFNYTVASSCDNLVIQTTDSFSHFYLGPAETLFTFTFI